MEEVGSGGTGGRGGGRGTSGAGSDRVSETDKEEGRGGCCIMARALEVMHLYLCDGLMNHGDVTELAHFHLNSLNSHVTLDSHSSDVIKH